MALLNYTTTVTAERSTREIASLLAKGGAVQVLTDYDEGRPTALSFALSTPTGIRRYRLPIDAAAVLVVLRRQRVPNRYANAGQAERVAWRILKDWVAAQLAIIETQMVTVDQVFLAYQLVGVDNRRSLYDVYLEDQTRALGAGEAV